MHLVLRSNYGDNSIAMMQAIYEKMQHPNEFDKVYVVYIDTGWAAIKWLDRVQMGQSFAKACGFTPIQLEPKAQWLHLVRDRKHFPSRKFQWCAGFLKGLPLLEWLDEHDSLGEWLIALPKRQALYRKAIPETISQCPYHGERDVWHPLFDVDDEQCEQWIKRAGFEPLRHRSLECEPCTNMSLSEFQNMSLQDKFKLAELEAAIDQKMFPHWANYQDKSTQTEDFTMDGFSMGCGDPFGCGL